MTDEEWDALIRRVYAEQKKIDGKAIEWSTPHSDNVDDRLTFAAWRAAIEETLSEATSEAAHWALVDYDERS